MEKQPIYTNSILTFVFTADGKLVVKNNKEGKIDTLPLLFMGYKEQDAKNDYEDSIQIINSRDDYSTAISNFFLYYGKETKNAFLDEWIISNPGYLLDCGQLTDSIRDNQIEEMANIDIPTYIRVNREYYDYGTYEGQQVVNEIETRYLVLPSNIDISDYHHLETKELEEITANIDMNILSDKIIIGTTGTNKNKMKSFVGTLKTLNKNNNNNNSSKK